MTNLFKKNPLKLKISDILIYALAFIPFLSTLIYYIYSLNNIALIFLGISLLFLVYLFSASKDNEHKKNNNEEKEINVLKCVNNLNKFKVNKKTLFFLVLFFISTIISFILLIQSKENGSIISPFEKINVIFFLFYSLSALSVLVLNYLKSTAIFWKLFCNIIFYFLSFSLFLFIFKLGYGFDPFVHKATMEHISQNGFILPKSPYYIGQYGLIIFISKITGLSIAFLNKTLVAILASLLFPITFFKYLKKIKLKKSTIVIPVLLILGFSPFILTTPQNLSYIFLILTIFYAIIEKDLKKSFIFSLSTVAIHPLSGLPAILFVIFSYFQNNKSKFKKINNKIIYIILFFVNSLAIPLSLFITTGKEFNFKYLISNLNYYLNSVFNISFPSKGSIFLNTAYFFINNYILFLLIIIIFALIYVKKLSKENEVFKNIFNLTALSTGSLIISFLITSSLSFSNVISYEQRDYALRILKIVLIHLLPIIIIFLSLMLDKIKDKKNYIKISALILASILLSISLYASYPRVDKYFNSRGYNTSYNDLKAVNKIENDAKNNKYFVLANQQVSAAALYEYGFDKNIFIDNSEHYFYPIPTGGLLYDYYLKMVYDEPSYENIKSALDLANVDFAYLVINKYWHQSAELINIAKIEADSYFDINNEIFIFKYLNK